VAVQITIPAQAGQPNSVPKALAVQVPAHALQQVSILSVFSFGRKAFRQIIVFYNWMKWQQTIAFKIHPTIVDKILSFNCTEKP
jgi:hypothetical protein